ncbi:MAG: ADP-ribosylglycohydrolase family protein [Kofleriaceae bacterium]
MDLTGVLVGTAVGDSLGLPREGLSARRAARLYKGPLRQRLGLLSDDTEHACLTLQALRQSTSPKHFARVLASQLRWWLLALPPAIGFGTLRALVRSWLGWPPSKSGVRSAGNGAVMRAPVIGAAIDDPHRIPAYVAASTAITHRDPRAYAGSLAIAIAAHHAQRGCTDAATILDHITREVRDPELLAALARVERALAADRSPAELAAELDLADGVTGYVHATVPMCLFVFLRSPRDLRRALTDVIALGGDTDTTAAIVGALVGANADPPAEWLRIIDWPLSLPRIRAIARDKSHAPWMLAIPARNLIFFAIVMMVGIRRLLPPY